MKTIIKIFLIISLLFLQTLLAQDTEMVKVTLVRKNVKAIIGNESINPKIDEEIPLSAKIECDKMGLLEFEYKGATYKVAKNVTVRLSEVVKGSGSKNFQPGMKTDTAGVRGLDKSKKKNQKKERENK